MAGAGIDTLSSATGVAAALVANDAKRRQDGCERLLLAARWADTHPVAPGDRGHHVGADGTPEVALFAVEELSCLTRQHRQAAHRLQADALNLRHRHPLLWKRIEAFEVVDWVAAKTARMVAAAGLALDQARWVDQETAEFVAELPLARYFSLVEAKIIEADQAAAEARREEAMARRFVRKTQQNEHGLKGLYGVGTFVGIDNVYATVDRAAAILLLQGDTDPADVRRSKAFELLANPVRLLELFAWAHEHADQVDALLGDHTDPSDRPGPTDAQLAALPQPAPSRAPRPPVVIHVHASLEAIRACSGIARIEDVGPISLAALKELLGHADITLKPVVDLTINASVDKYEIPTFMKETSRERFPFEVFPYGTTPARRADQDHSTPYRLISEGGPPGQTNVDNLGPLGRRAHRVKTFAGGWRHIRIGPRSFLWRTPTGYWCRVDPDGTTWLGQEPSMAEEHLKAWLYAG